jgi:hypothetical protein
MKSSLLVLSLLVGTNAFATGGISCSGENKDVKFEFSATTGIGFGNPIVEAAGKVEYKDVSAPGFDINSVGFDKSNVVNYWGMDLEQTSVAFSVADGEATNHGVVRGVLKVQASGDGALTGVLELTKKIYGPENYEKTTKNTLALKCQI